MTNEQFAEIKSELNEMRAEIKPVIDTFNTLRALGKWTAVLAAFVGSLVAIAVGIKEFFKR